MVEGKLNDWFDYRREFIAFAIKRRLDNSTGLEYGLYKWLRTNTVDRFYIETDKQDSDGPSKMINGWKERADAREQLHRYLTDMPSTSTI
jgi:hypothetical protein